MTKLGPEEERDLISRVRSGDSRERDAAFERLYALFAADVLAFCLSVTRRRRDAEDAAQETFLAVHRGLPGFRGESRLATWIYRIAARLALRERSRWRLPFFPLAEEEPIAPAGPDTVERREASERIASALDRLPRLQRLVVSLFAIDGLSHAEIAEVLGVPVGTAWSRLHAARKRLAQMLGPDL